jgi:hypothetical protein
MIRVLSCLADPEKIRAIAEAAREKAIRNLKQSAVKIMKGVDFNE